MAGTTGPRDAVFHQWLVDHGIYPTLSNVRPSNFEALKKMLAEKQESPQQLDSANERFLNFVKKNEMVTTEPMVRRTILPILLKDMLDGSPSGEEYIFKNMKDLITGISKLKPDYFEGSHPSDLPKDTRNELQAFIVPSTYGDRPMLPNFFLELKGPTGDMAELKLQIVYDLVIGARAMYKLQTYGQTRPEFDGNAYTIGATYFSPSASLILWTVHPFRPQHPTHELNYHTTKLCSFLMDDLEEDFNRGLLALENARTWAKKQRQMLIAAVVGVETDEINPGGNGIAKSCDG
jgi:hypothetical protein